MIHRVDSGIINLAKCDLLIDSVLASPYPYEQQLVKYIKHAGSCMAFGPTDVLDSAEGCPLKIEGYERLSPKLWQVCKDLAERHGHEGYVSAHLFISPKGSLSFPMHKDLDDVYVYMVEGAKTFKTDGDDFDLVAGDMLHIPRGENHQAINTSDSIMISFGLELFIEQKL